MTAPKPRQVYDNPDTYWDFVTISTNASSKVNILIGEFVPNVAAMVDNIVFSLEWRCGDR